MAPGPALARRRLLRGFFGSSTTPSLSLGFPNVIVTLHLVKRSNSGRWFTFEFTKAKKGSSVLARLANAHQHVTPRYKCSVATPS